MSTHVYANNNEIASKASEGKSIAAFPDVCFSPPAPPVGPMPLPYPNTGEAADLDKGSDKVFIKDTMIGLENDSYLAKSTGDEGATISQNKGVITSELQGKVCFQVASTDVKIQGKGVTRNLDITTGNHFGMVPGSTPPFAHLSVAFPPPRIPELKRMPKNRFVVDFFHSPETKMNMDGDLATCLVAVKTAVKANPYTTGIEFYPAISAVGEHRQFVNIHSSKAQNYYTKAFGGLYSAARFGRRVFVVVAFSKPLEENTSVILQLKCSPPVLSCENAVPCEDDVLFDSSTVNLEKGELFGVQEFELREIAGRTYSITATVDGIQRDGRKTLLSSHYAFVNMAWYTGFDRSKAIKAMMLCQAEYKKYSIVLEAIFSDNFQGDASLTYPLATKAPNSVVYNKSNTPYSVDVLIYKQIVDIEEVNLIQQNIMLSDNQKLVIYPPGGRIIRIPGGVMKLTVTAESGKAKVLQTKYCTYSEMAVGTEAVSGSVRVAFNPNIDNTSIDIGNPNYARCCIVHTGDIFRELNLSAQSNITISVKLNCRCLTLGLSFGQTNLIVLVDENFDAEYWKFASVSALDIGQTLIHELGHKLQTPTAESKYYYSLDGGHCCFSKENDWKMHIDKTEEQKSLLPKGCVMHGFSSNCLTFCPHCGVILRKQSHDAGWKTIK